MADSSSKDPMMQPCRRGCGELVHLENDGFHVCRTSNEVTHRMGIIAALVKKHETQEALRDGIAEIERLTRERDEAQERFEEMRDVVYNTANVERDHLRAALQKVLAASVPAGYDAGYAVTEAIAREALSGEHQQVETSEPYLYNRATGVEGVYCIARKRDGTTEYWTGKCWAAFCNDLYFDLRSPEKARGEHD